MKILLLILCSALFAPIPMTDANAQEPSDLSLSVSLTQKNNTQYLLELELVNKSATKATVQNLDLPWIPPNEMIFVNRVYRMDKAQTQLEKFGPMADYMDLPHVLNQGQSIRGAIDLNVMLPTLAEDVKKFGVTVEWVCRSKALRFQCWEGNGGQFTLPQKSKRKSAISHSSTVPSIK